MTQPPFGNDQAERHRHRGLKLLERGAFGEAAEQFRRNLRANPSSLTDRILLSQALLQAARLGDAEAELRHALQLAPDNPDIHAQLGRVVAKGGHRVRAALHFERAMALDAHHPAHAEWLEQRAQISRSVHAWHLPMLADTVRNDAFQSAIEAAVTPDDVVLDIGTGTGLLAMMAARAGARRVVACEALPDLADLARLVVEANGYGDRIDVVAKPSTSLAVGADMPERATLLVSETFDALLIGEGALDWFAHAREHLLAPGGRIIPAGGTVRAQLASVPRLKRMHPLGEVSGFDLRPFARRALEKQFYPVRLESEPWTALSDPFDVIGFDFARSIPPRQSWSLPVTATAEGVVDALVLWFDLRLDDATHLTSGPSNRRSSHWDPVVFLFDESCRVARGTAVELRARMGNNVFFFESPRVAAPPSRPPARRDLVIGMAGLPPNLHPMIRPFLLGTRYVLSFALRGLTQPDAEGRTISHFCTEVPSMRNGRVRMVERPDGGQGMEVTFTLRPGLRWGDGSPLTTADVVFGARVEWLFRPTAYVADVVALDERTYRIILDAPRWDFDRLSPVPINRAIEEPILDAAASPLDYLVASAFNRTPDLPGLWNGPFLLTGFRPGHDITLGRNPFWDGELRGIKSTSLLQDGLVAGDIDMAHGLTTDQALDLRTHHSAAFDVQLRVGYFTVSLVLQTRHPPLDDRRVRQAVMLGIDREGIVSGLYDGLLPVAASVTPPSDPSHNWDLVQWPYDPSRARALLISAGYSRGPDGMMRDQRGEPLAVGLVAAAGNHNRQVLLEAIRGQLHLVGIDVRVETQPFTWMADRLLAHRELQGMAINGWDNTPGQVPLNLLSTAGIPGEGNGHAGHNYAGYSNPVVDERLEKALVEANPTARTALLKEVQAIVMEDLPLIPLFHGADVLCAPRWLTGVMPVRSVLHASLWAEHWKTNGRPAA